MDKKKLVESIRKMCAERNISVRKLEASVDFGNGTISKWEEASPSLDNVLKVCDYFGITPNELLGYSEITHMMLKEVIGLKLRVDELEKTQRRAVDMVYEYISNSEAVAVMQQEILQQLPKKIENVLQHLTENTRC